MYPQQPDSHQSRGDYPPQSPAPPPAIPYNQAATTPPTQPAAASPNPQPWAGQPQMQPGQNYTPMHNYSPMPSPQNRPPAGWYTPPSSSTPNDKPASVDSYLSRASTPTSTQPSAPPSGQRINGQYAVDYLGGIAPDNTNDTITVAGKRFSKKVFFIAIGGTVALLLAASLLLFSPKPQGAARLNESTLYVSMVDTADVTKEAGDNIKDSNLRALNSSLRALLNGSIKQMDEPLLDSGASPSSLASSAKKAPYKDEELREKLEDARLLGTYDQTYTREMNLKIDTMLITMERIKKNNGRQSMQTFVDDNLPDYKDFLQSLKEHDEGVE